MVKSSINGVQVELPVVTTWWLFVKLNYSKIATDQDKEEDKDKDKSFKHGQKLQVYIFIFVIKESFYLVLNSKVLSAIKKSYSFYLIIKFLFKCTTLAIFCHFTLLMLKMFDKKKI